MHKSEAAETEIYCLGIVISTVSKVLARANWCSLTVTLRLVLMLNKIHQNEFYFIMLLCFFFFIVGDLIRQK